MITTLLFDLGGVLFSNGTKTFIKELSISYSLPEQTIKEVIDGEIGSLYRESKISRDEFWRRVIEKLHLRESADILEQKWINGYDLITGTRDIIMQLSKNYHIFYLSDNVKERVDALDKRFDFKRLFSGGIFSHEVGVRKPNPKIYEFTLIKTNSKPEETLFIDDKPHLLEPAQKMGMSTLLFTSAPELKSQLEKIGVITN